ncbi:MAG TPA: hypothetical protein VHP58_05705 [Alphaproteobacteria bacterium]|nr:hypothetical protein [Alphaproteobacteria bacterium]
MNTLLLDTLAQTLLGAVTRRPTRGMTDLLHGLLWQAVGLVAAIVIAVVAVLCAIAGGIVMLAPQPLDVPQVLFILAALFVFLSLVTWLIVCKGKSPRQMVADALGAPTSPLDYVNKTFDRVSDAFSRGWHNAR